MGLKPEDIESAVELLLVSAVRLTELCLPHLRAKPRRPHHQHRVELGRDPIDNLALSNAVRPGVVGWAKTLARELGPDGITVNTIAPGRIDTPRVREVYPTGRPRPTCAASRSGGSAIRARSATSCASSPRHAAPT